MSKTSVIRPCLVLLSAGLLLSPGQGSAQDEDTDAAEDLVLEEVLVTGSRIIRSALDSPSPVTVFDASDLIDNGITTVEEFARYLPQNADTFSDSMTAGGPVRGSSGFNLRGIGLDATLTLVNGRRVAAFGASSDFAPFVDINTIPVAAIERIEVLKDGASAIYGSEAVAGVVNIITRRQLDGWVVEGGYLGNDNGDGEEWDLSVTGGWTGHNTQLIGTLSYFSREVIWSRDRDYSASADFSDRGGFDDRSRFSSPPTIDGIDVDGNPLFRLPDPACGTNPDIASTDIRAPDFGFCRFDYQQFTTQQQPSDRLGLTGNLVHDFDNGLELFAEVLYSYNETESVLAPTPLNGFFVLADHPNNPFADRFPEAQFLVTQARALDIGDRLLRTEATAWRAVAGLRGAWSDWAWEAALMRSEGKTDQPSLNTILRSEFQEALLGMAGPNGDQYYNPFGANPQNPPEVIDHFLVSGLTEMQTNTETTLDLQLSGSPGTLPGGDIGAAVGIQFRQQDVRQTADEQLTGGQLAGRVSFEPINADRDIWSAYAEILLPLHDVLEAQLALRVDDYSDFGSTTNPKIGLGWRPVPAVLVRATWGTSFRPPTFRNLYDPRIEFPRGIFQDPFRCGISGDQQDCFGRGVQFSSQGNPDLQPDEGETMLLGVAWEPAFAEGLTIQFDYWQIEHSDRILLTDQRPLADALLEQLDPFTNPFYLRAPQSPEDLALGIPGPITQWNATYVNAGQIDTNGYDLDVNYEFSTTVGDFSTTLSYTHLNEYSFGSDFLGIEVNDDFAGGYAFFSALPENRATLRLGWARGAHGVFALVSYADEFESSLNTVVDQQETDIPFIIDSYTQLDLQYSYVFEQLRDATLRVGCRNCTDQDPPVNNERSSTEPFHEGRGLLFYLRWTQPF